MRKEIKYYSLYSIITLFLLFVAFDLRHCDLSVPLYYTGQTDALQFQTWIKTMLETGWVHVNPRLGAPGVMDLYDFPIPEALDFLTIKGLLTIVGDSAVAHNLFYLLGFFASGWTSLLVLRASGLSGPVALSASLLFAFLPGHFWRGTWHLHLAFYAAIPLAVLLCLWICEGRPIFARAAVGTEASNGRPFRRAAAALAICLIVSTTAVYFAWFFGFFLVVSGLIAWLRRPRPAPPRDAIVCIVLLLAGMTAQAIPHAVHRMAHGVIEGGFKRDPASSKNWRLPVAVLLLPTIGHRIPQLRVLESRRSIGGDADPRDPFIGKRVAINEKYFNALGMIGASGFLFLFLVLLALPSPWLDRLHPAADLAKLNNSAVLLGTGLCVLLEFVMPLIRAYNRIAFYIAFFSLYAVGLVAERLRPGPGASARANALFLTALVGGTAIGLLDQIPGVITPDYKTERAIYAGEADYVRKVESILDRNASVFQLPYTEYPEADGSYLHFRPYLHSKSLIWSYGAMRGSKADTWQREVSKKPVPVMIDEIRRASFTGLHVDLGIDPKHTGALKRELDRELGPPSVVGNCDRWVFYRLADREKPTISSSR